MAKETQDPRKTGSAPQADKRIDRSAGDGGEHGLKKAKERPVGEPEQAREEAPIGWDFGPDGPPVDTAGEIGGERVNVIVGEEVADGTVTSSIPASADGSPAGNVEPRGEGPWETGGAVADDASPPAAGGGDSSVGRTVIPGDRQNPQDERPGVGGGDGPTLVEVPDTGGAVRPPLPGVPGPGPVTPEGPGGETGGEPGGPGDGGGGDTRPPLVAQPGAGSVQEDVVLSVSGQLDATGSGNVNWSLVGDATGDYGGFVLGRDGSWSYALDNDTAQGLKAGETVQEIFTVKVTDASGASSLQIVTVTVTGTNDEPVISGATVGVVGEDEALSTSGALVAADRDIGDTASWSVADAGEGSYGSFTLNPDGSWSYTLDNDVAQGLRAGETVDEIFTVTVTDATGASDTQTITITVKGTNDIPVISGSETGFVDEDGTLTASGALTVTDADIGDTAAWSVAGSSDGQYGTLVLGEDGQWSYTLDNDAAQGLKAGETVQEIFTVTVTDAEGASDTQTITITVTGTNDAPVISGTETGTVQEDETLTASGALTSTDPDIGDTATWSVVGPSDGNYGSLVLGDDGQWTYTLNNDAAQGLKADETAQEIFTVVVTDASGATDTRTVTVTITGTNDAPVISGVATGIVQEDEVPTVSGVLTSSDADIGDTATWSVVGNPDGSYGSLTLNPDGSWSYALDNEAAQGMKAGDSVQDIFTVKVTDSAGAEVTQTITVTVNGTNDVPVISGTATGAVDEDGAMTASGVLTTSDADIGDTATWSVVGDDDGAYGSLTLGDDGRWSYVLDNDAAQGLKAGETVQEIFTVKVTDSAGAEVTRTITVTVTGTNDTPVISGAGTGTVEEDGLLSASGTLTSSDADIGDTAAWSVVGSSEGQYGDLVLGDDGSWSYTLDNDSAQGLKAGETAQEIFTIKVTDSEGASATQTITVTVTGTNDAPVISGTATGVVEEDETLTASGRLTSSDPDIGDTATWSVVGDTAGSYGMLTLNPDGSWSYALDNDSAQGLGAGESAEETFIVRVTDSGGASVEQTITVTVSGTNDIPVISGAGTGAVREDEILTASGTLTAADADIGDTATWTIVGENEGHYGSLTLGEDGSWTYMIDNDAAQGLKAGDTAQEIFTVKVTDSAGASTTQTVTITVTGTNDVPVISGTATGSVAEDGTLTAGGKLDVSDADIGDTANWSVVGDGEGAYGSVTLNPDGSWSYLLDNDAAQGLKAGDTAQDIFTVKVTDAAGAEVTQTITVTVTGTNDTPTISGTETGTVQEDETSIASGSLAVSDADIGDTVSWSLVGNSDGSYGSLTLGPDGSWSYSLDNDAAQGLKAGETAQEIFTVKATDESGSSDTQTVTITVTGTNDAPVISGITTGSVLEDGTLAAGGKLDVFDADIGDTASWSVVGGDAGNYGSITVDENGRWSYTLDNDKAQGLKAGETVEETFIVRVTDSDGASAEQTITVTVGGTNDVPVISGTSTGQVREDVTLTATGTLTAADADFGDTASWSVDGATVSDYGVFAIDPDSGQWTFTLNNDTAQGLKAGETIRETFTVTATDSAGASETHLVSVEITGTNDGPEVGQAVNHMGSMKEDTSVTFSVDDLLRGAQVTDIDQDNLTITSVELDGSSAPGTLVDNGNGTWTFTPDHNVSNANAGIVFQVSDGRTSVNAQATVSIQPVADPAEVSISSSAVQEVIKTGAPDDLGRIVAPQLTTKQLTEFTLEFTVVGNSVPESTTGAGPVIVNIGSPPSDKNTLTLWDPANMKVGMSKLGGGDLNVPTGIDLTDGQSHRITVTYDGATKTLKVYDNGELALTTSLPKALPSNLYMAVAEKANTPPTTGNPSGGGYRPNEHFEGTIYNVAMSSKAETAGQVKEAPLAEQADDKDLLIDLRAQDGKIVDTTGRNSIKTGGDIDTDALSVDTTLGSAPVGSVVHLDINTTLTDPNDHITQLVISGFVAGTVVSDGAHSITITGPTQKIDITDWSLDKMTADLPDGVRTSMDLKVTATTTTPPYETGEFDAQGEPILATDNATSDEHHILMVEGAGPPPPLPPEEEIVVTAPGDDQSGTGDIVVIPGDVTDSDGGTTGESSSGNPQQTKPGTPSDGGTTTAPPGSGTGTGDGSGTIPPSSGTDAGSGGTTESGSGETGTIVIPGTDPPISAGGDGATGEISTGTTEPPATGTQPDGGGTTSPPTGGAGSDGSQTIPDTLPPLSAGGGDTTGDGSTVTTAPPASGGQSTGDGTTAGSGDGGTDIGGGETTPDTTLPPLAGGGDTTGETSTGTTEPPTAGTQPDGSGATTDPSTGGTGTGDGGAAIPPDIGSGGTGTVTAPETEPPISTGDGSTGEPSVIPPAGGGDAGSETTVPGDGGGEAAPPPVAEPVDANGQVEFVSVNDWYNPSWGGGYNATFQLTLTDDMLKGGSLEGWSLQMGIDNPSAVVTTGWLDGFNGTVTFDPATGIFTNDGQDYQPELHAGDVIQFTIQVQNVGFDRDDFSFSFKDLDPVPEGTAANTDTDAIAFTPTEQALDSWANAADTQALSAVAEAGAHEVATAAPDGPAPDHSGTEPTHPDQDVQTPAEVPTVQEQPIPSAASAYLEFVQPQDDSPAAGALPANDQPSSADAYLQMADAADQAGQEPPPPDHLFADAQIEHGAEPGAYAPDTEPHGTHDDAAAAAAGAEPSPLENEDQNHHNH